MSDKVFISVTLFKHVMTLERKRKLVPKYIEPYEKVELVGKVAYKIALPANIHCIHNVFHASLLHMYIRDLSHMLKVKKINLLNNLTNEERPIQILDKRVKEF